MFRTARQFVPRTRASFLRHAPRQAATNVLERGFSGSRVLRCAESEVIEFPLNLEQRYVKLPLDALHAICNTTLSQFQSARAAQKKHSATLDTTS